jgi:hypothetical protein
MLTMKSALRYRRIRGSSSQRREQRTAHQQREAKSRQAALQSSDFIQLAHEIVPLREDALRPLVDDLARGCELAAMADAIEQRHPNLVLELLDRLADRRLCRGHGFGGPREAALPGILLPSFRSQTRNPGSRGGAEQLIGFGQC